MEIPGHGKINAPSEIPTGGLGEFFNGAGGLMTFAFVVGSLLALFFMLHGGYMWITSGGDKTKIASARNRIIYSIIGLIIIFLAFAIVMSVGTFIGVDLTQSPT